MTDWESKVWTDDRLTAFVVVLAVVVVSGAMILLGWVMNMLGAFDPVKELFWGQ